MIRRRTEAAFFATVWLLATVYSTICATANASRNSILVVGSVNADTFLPVSRLPSEGENIMLRPGEQPVVDVPGGKGCTQAVAAAKLLRGVDCSCAFVGQFGNDPAASILQQTLEDESVDISLSGKHDDLPSGRGYVFLTESGSVSAVVSGGSNAEGWSSWENTWGQMDGSEKSGEPTSDQSMALTKKDFDHMFLGIKCVLLQREVPEFVNKLVAKEAKKRGDIVVFQDIGGEDRAIDEEMLKLCDFVVPNQSELSRLVQSLEAGSGKPVNRRSADDDNERIVQQAKILQKHGARNVLVTRGSHGSTLVTEVGEILHQPALPLEASAVLDETGAGDCYRAGFAVAFMEGHSLQQCMEFATAAGYCSVQSHGAVPSTPTRSQVEEAYQRLVSTDTVLNIPRGDGQQSPRTSNTSSGTGIRGGGTTSSDDFPFLIGSRLNSMKDRPELWTESPLNGPPDFVKRQAKIKGLTCVDFNYPQHFQHYWKSNADARQALVDAGMVAGAVCLRFPSKFARGAMNHPDPELRREAIELTKQAAQVAIDLGCREVVVWSAYDGYDYPFQVDYDEKWQELVDAFQECCDAFPNIKFSVEYKPTDENTRFFTVPSTGAALLLVDEIDRANMGLTLDVGHMLMSGENPGQSIAMVGRKKKLFGIQLNDGYTRLAAEDGMMFGSIHPSMALEIMYQLRRIGFGGHLYFDTFPQRTDPIKEAEYNIRRVKAFWWAAASITKEKIKMATDKHDAIAALELVDDLLRSL